MALSKPRTSFLIERNEAFNASIITPFKIIRKITGRQFTHLPVIVQAVATNTLPAAGIRTVTFTGISRFITFHFCEALVYHMDFLSNGSWYGMFGYYCAFKYDHFFSDFNEKLRRDSDLEAFSQYAILSIRVPQDISFN